MKTVSFFDFKTNSLSKNLWMSNIKSKRTISIYEHLYYRIPSETNKSKALSNLKVLHRPWTCTSVSFIDVRNLARKLLRFVPFMKNTKRKRNKKRSIQNDFEKKRNKSGKKARRLTQSFFSLSFRRVGLLFLTKNVRRRDLNAPIININIRHS